MAAVTFGTRRRARRPSTPERKHAALTAAGVLQTYDRVYGGPAGAFFTTRSEERGYEFYGHDSWPHDGVELDIAGALLVDGATAAFELADGTLAMVNVRDGWATVSAASHEGASVAAAFAAFRAKYPASYLQQGDERVALTFWTLGQHGPISRLRRVDASPWAAIEENYPPDVREQLGALMTSFEPGKSGQLLLWQGPPGTGKTWGLRALAHEWSDWAEFHVITDRDAFFIDDASYMIDVLLADSYQALDGPTGDVYEVDGGGKWRVLVLEDTGELLSANAKEKYGQGLSRLLNVVDGLIGQGLRVLCLVTTNDELGELSPAVRRPGRCASQIVFRALSDDEAAAWLGDAADGPATIAELYARRGDAAPALDDPVGGPQTPQDEPEPLPAAAVSPAPVEAVDAAVEEETELAELLRLAARPLPLAASAPAPPVARPAEEREGVSERLLALSEESMRLARLSLERPAGAPTDDRAVAALERNAERLADVARAAVSREHPPAAVTHVHLPESPLSLRVEGAHVEVPAGETHNHFEVAAPEVHNHVDVAPAEVVVQATPAAAAAPGEPRVVAVRTEFDDEGRRMLVPVYEEAS